MVKLFGSTILETKHILETSIHAGPDQVTKEDKVKVIGRIVVSCLMIFLAAYLITDKDSNESAKSIAGTIIGAVTGYWIK